MYILVIHLVQCHCHVQDFLKLEFKFDAKSPSAFALRYVSTIRSLLIHATANKRTSWVQIV